MRVHHDRDRLTHLVRPADDLEVVRQDLRSDRRSAENETQRREDHYCHEPKPVCSYPSYTVDGRTFPVWRSEGLVSTGRWSTITP